jgi:outer membrane protein assembly factor BamB
VIIELDPEWTPDAAPRPRRNRRRQALSAGVAVSLLLTLILGGSTRPEPALRHLVLVPAVVGDPFVLAGDHVFVVTYSYTTVIDYQLPSGRPLWRATLPDPATSLRLQVSAGVVLTEMGDPSQGSSRVLALDAGTGHELWRASDADLVAGTGDPHVLLMPVDPAGPRRLRSVDPRTGAPLWSVAVEQRSDVVMGTGWLALRSSDGLTRIIDEDGGRVTASRQLTDPPVTDPLIPTAAPPVGSPGMFVVGNILFATYLYANTTTVAAYRADTLTPLWRTTVDDVVFSATDCGAVLCLHAAQSLIAVTPATGTIRWNINAWSDAVAWGRWLRASDFTGDGRTRLALLDPDTGAIRLDLGDWFPVPQTGGDTPTLLARSQVGRLGTWVAATGDDPTRLHLLDWLPDAVTDECRLDAVDRIYLVCPTHTGNIHVWVYHP